MIELLGPVPTNVSHAGKHAEKFFDSTGHLRRIRGLNYWSLKKVLVEKYRIKEDEAQAFSDFLVPMLNWSGDKRASAQEMLKHPWLSMEDNDDYKMTEEQYKNFMMKKEVK